MVGGYPYVFPYLGSSLSFYCVSLLSVHFSDGMCPVSANRAPHIYFLFYPKNKVYCHFKVKNVPNETNRLLSD